MRYKSNHFYSSAKSAFSPCLLNEQHNGKKKKVGPKPASHGFISHIYCQILTQNIVN